MSFPISETDYAYPSERARPLDRSYFTATLPPHYRRTVYKGRLGKVIDAAFSPFQPTSAGSADCHQIALTYAGLFSHTVDKRTLLCDSSRILFTIEGQEFTEGHPVPGLGHASIIIEPAPRVLEELCGKRSPEDHGAFRSASRASSPRLRLLAHRLLRLQAHGADDLEADELTLMVTREALAPSNGPTYGRPSRVVERAKKLLHAMEGARIGLQQVAESVGVSPVYLTQEFTRSEGVPLYRYQTLLRLSRALLDLPDRDDITGLALDLGFSNHSHFGSAFKATFGLTPSSFRKAARGLPTDERRRDLGMIVKRAGKKHAAVSAAGLLF